MNYVKFKYEMFIKLPFTILNLHRKLKFTQSVVSKNAFGLFKTITNQPNLKYQVRRNNKINFWKWWNKGHCNNAYSLILPLGIGLVQCKSNINQNEKRFLRAVQYGLGPEVKK